MSKKLFIGLVYHSEYIHPNIMKDWEKLAVKYKDKVGFAISVDGDKSDVKIPGVLNIYADKHYGAPIIPRYNIAKYALDNGYDYVFTCDRDDYVKNFDDIIENMLYNIENYSDCVYFQYKYNIETGEIPTISHQVIKSSYYVDMFEKHLIQYPKLRLYEDNITEAYFDNSLPHYCVQNIIFEEEFTDMSEFLTYTNDSHLTVADSKFTPYNKTCLGNQSLPVDVLRYIYEQLICNNPYQTLFDESTKQIIKRLYEKNKDKDMFTGYDLYVFFKYFYYANSGRAWYEMPNGKEYIRSNLNEK